jgi:hypothetical protein
MERRSHNPLHELGLLRHLVQLYRHEQPHVIHHFTIKCVVYGAITASLARVPARVNHAFRPGAGPKDVGSLADVDCGGWLPLNSRGVVINAMCLMYLLVGRGGLAADLTLGGFLAAKAAPTAQ